MAIGWKIGFEFELLAPPGVNRFDLAHAAAGSGGSVERIFYPQAEYSAVAGRPVFETLTLGYKACGSDGSTLAKFVDDLTLQDDLDRSATPKPGWYRILGDDVRLMRLIGRHCSASAPIEAVLEPAAILFGGRLEANEQGYWKLVDSSGASIAMAVPLTGERERACEIISAPITDGHAQALDHLLKPARDLGFLLPSEGAVHLHFDAARLASPPIMRRLVRYFHDHRDALRTRLGPNPRCRRLGASPETLLETVDAPGFDQLPWEEARRRLAQSGLSKFCDFNIVNIVGMDPDKFTFEIRILPPALEADPVIVAAHHIAAILDELVNG